VLRKGIRSSYYYSGTLNVNWKIWVDIAEKLLTHSLTLMVIVVSVLLNSGDNKYKCTFYRFVQS
jgi:hypothetical protein